MSLDSGFKNVHNLIYKLLLKQIFCLYYSPYRLICVYLIITVKNYKINIIDDVICSTSIYFSW